MAPMPPPSPAPQNASPSPSVQGKPTQTPTSSTPTTADKAQSSAPSPLRALPPERVVQASQATARLELYVAIRRGRVALLTTTTMLFLLTMVFTFREGVELNRFKDSEKTSAQQTELLDEYNSYSGNVASLFGTPVELFVSAAVQVILLRFMTQAITQAVPNWKMSLVSVIVGAIAAYLISNGFNAMNVQLRPLKIEPVISAEDLSLASNASAPGLSTNMTHTYPETQPRNPITNTMLRNAVLPRVLNQQPYCSIRGGLTTPRTDITFGFTQRDWQTRVLQEALPVKQLRVVVTQTNATLQDAVTSGALPMKASLAADLYLYGMYLMTDMFNMGKKFLNETEIIARNPQLGSFLNAESSAPEPTNVSLAKVVGFLPLDDEEDDTARDETAQRGFFLERSTASLRRHLASVAHTSTNEIELIFSHVQITDNVNFDAITIEFEIDSMLMADASTTDNATRFTELRGCGPTVGHCLVPKALYGDDDFQYDLAAQIQAFGQCVNAAGTDELRALSFSGEYPDQLDCKSASNTSFLVFSVGKRVVADALTPNHTMTVRKLNSTESGLKYGKDDTVATDVRKLFTVTIGRLSWQWNDLASDFHASCIVEDAEDNCLGLQLPLANSSSSPSTQLLVAGASTLSVGTLSPFNTLLTYGNQRLLPLALVREAPPPRKQSSSGADKLSDILAGDMLLPHNIKRRNWTDLSAEVDRGSCSAQVEDRIRSTLNNHLYNEHGLQATYTAAVFFLFENAVVRDVIPLNSTSATLDFAHNVRHISVWLSVPGQSVWLTLAGCILLVVGLAAAILCSMALSKSKSDSLAKITAPHVIARVVLDEGQFPPLLLHRHIVSSRGSDVHMKMDQFAIDSLGLKDQQHDNHLAAVA